MTERTFIGEDADGLVPEKSQVIQVNFTNGTIQNKIEYEDEGGIPKFFRNLAKFSKTEKVVSAVVLIITEDDHVDWVNVAQNPHHLALAALCLDDIKDDLKSKIFETEDDTEESE
jgi:hypothetical protein